MKKLELNIYGIVISYDPQDKGSCAITSKMKELPETEENAEFNAAVDGIESMMLGHFSAGVELTAPAYLTGIETAYNAIGANFS